MRDLAGVYKPVTTLDAGLVAALIGPVKREVPERGARDGHSIRQRNEALVSRQASLTLLSADRVPEAGHTDARDMLELHWIVRASHSSTRPYATSGGKELSVR